MFKIQDSGTRRVSKKNSLVSISNIAEFKEKSFWRLIVSNISLAKWGVYDC